MASPTERWKSSGHFTEQNTFLKQMKDFGKRSVVFEDEFSTLARQHLKAMQLQQDLVQLQERERRAKQRNRQLLQQFEQAQSALEEIMTCNTTMKAIRMEYERYLEERAPCWQQQFKEKTKAAQTERMEKHLKPSLEEVEYPAPKVTADDSFSQAGEQKTAAAEASSPPECSYNQDGCPHPFTWCSWLTHSQSRTSKFPIRGSYPPQSPALLSPPYIPHPHSFLVQPFSAFPPYPWSRKDPAVWASPQHGYPWLDGTSLGSRGYKEEPPELRGSQNVENSKRSSRSSHLSQELDIKPVRLSSRHSESSGSSRSPTLSTKGKRKTRGRVELSSSDMNSEESSRTSSVVASVAEFQLLEDLSSDKSSFRRTQKSEGLTAASPRSDNEAEERNEKKRSGRQNGENQRCEVESGSSSEGSMQVKEGKQRHGEELQNCRGEESEKDDKKIKNEAVGEEEKQSSGSWEQRNAKEEEIETNLSSGGEEKGQKSQEQENRDLEEEEDSSRKTTTEEDAGTAAEEEDQDEEAGTAAEEEDREEDAGTAAEEEDREEEAGTAAEEEDREEDAGTAAEEEDREEEAGTAAEDEDQEEEAGTAAEEEDQDEEAGTAGEEEDQEEDAGTAAEEEDQDEDAGTAAEEEDQDEDAGTAAEDEDQEEEPPEDFDDKKIKQDTSSQDEDEEEMESSEKNEEEESKSDEEGKTDSDDSIISPQNKRNKEKECQLVLVTPAEEGVLQSSTQMQTIPETAAEEEEDDEDDSKAPYDENAAESSDEDDVENVLAPQDRKQKDVSRVDLFRVTEDRRKTRSPDHNHQSDSDEFDHFYD